LESLILFRVLQGAAGGGLAPLEQAILVDTFPKKNRAAAFGLYSMAVVLAPAMGPTLGGWITDNFSWRWVFYINIPVGILSLILTSQLVRDPPEITRETRRLRQTGKIRIDYLGILLIALGLGCLQVVLDRGQEEDWFGSTLITVCTVITLGALSLAIIWELTRRDPVVDLSLVKERNFSLSLIFIFFFGFLLYGTTLLLPQFLQTMQGYQAQLAGQVLAPAALLVLATAPFVVNSSSLGLLS
jgi:DHA2 family multidrug resistance protein